MLVEKTLNFPLVTHRHWPLLLATFGLIFLTQIPQLYLIGNFNDCGYFLTNQELAYQLGAQYIKIAPWWWLSDLIGGWWLKLTEGHGIWGAKLGGALMLALSGAASANTLFQIMRPTFSIVFGLVLAGLCLPNEMINYIAVPTLLYALFGLYFLKMTLDPTHRYYPILSGLFFALLVFSRMPLIVTLFIPSLSLLACYLFEKSKFPLLINASLKMGVVIFASFFLFILFLYSQGLLASYFLYQSPSKGHNFFSLFSLLIDQFTDKIPRLILISTTASVLYFFIKKNSLKTKFSTYTSIAFLLFCLLLIPLYLKHPHLKPLLKSIWPDGFDVYPILVSLLTICICLLRTALRFEEIVLFILGVSWPFLRALGSVSGLQWGIVVGFLLSGSVAALLSQVASTYQCKKPLLCLGALLSLMMGGKAVKGVTDLIPSSAIQIANPELKKLNGIYTTFDRAENLRSLIHEIKKHTKKGDRILACPYIPIIYYASDTLPLGNHSCLFFLPTEQFSAKLDQIVNMGSPALIVRPKLNKHVFGWPANSDFLNDLEEKLMIFETKIMSAWNFKLLWSNDHYEIYSK